MKTVLATVLVLCAAAVAQQEQTPANHVADVASSPTVIQPQTSPGLQTVAAGFIQLRAGQQVGLVLKTRLSSEQAKVGDVVNLEVVRDIKVDGLVVIAAGTPAQAEVVLAQPRGRKGVGGTLAIAFCNIRVIAGGVVQLAGKELQHGSDKKSQIDSNMGDIIVSTLGFGTPLAPLFLLQKGGSVLLDPGTRLSAFLAEDVTLERSAIEDHQPVTSRELATIYMFKGWHPTCGSMELPFDLPQKSVLRLELPPGQYWFHTGASEGLVRGILAGTVGGLTFGAVMPSPFSMKKVLKRPITEFTMLEVKGGGTYYLRAAYDAHSKVKQQLRLIEAAEGEKLLDEPNAPYYIVRDLSPDMIEQLRAQPIGENSKQ